MSNSKDFIPKSEYIGKIIWAEMSKESCFVWDDKGIFIEATCFFIPDADKYLLGLLNSKIIHFYMKNFASTLGEGAFRWKKQYVELLPIAKISENDQKPFITLIDKILESKDKNTDTQGLEKTLDNMIYKLYDLYDDEIAWIESH